MNVFQFAMHLSQLRNSINETNALSLQSIKNETQKYYSKIEFCISLQFKTFMNEIFALSNHPIPQQFNFDEKYAEIKDIFDWNENKMKMIFL